jgi:hypothetical protein
MNGECPIPELYGQILAAHERLKLLPGLPLSATTTRGATLRADSPADPAVAADLVFFRDVRRHRAPLNFLIFHDFTPLSV